MMTRAAVLLAGALLLLAGGCGGSEPSATPTTTAPASRVPSPSVVPPASTATEPKPTVAIGTTMAVGVPDGWVVQRSPLASSSSSGSGAAADDESGSVCLLPKGSTEVVFDCAGVELDFGPHLPGAHTDAYAADKPDGWYSATDVEPCPFGKHDLTATKFVGIRTEPGFDRGLRPVGTHRASWNRWTASCAGRTFHPQAWFLPTSQVVVFDYLDHPETASILASAVFAKDGVAMPPSPTFLSAHVLSGTGTQLVVKPFRTYTNDAAGKAYAAAHGLGFPFPDDYADADIGGKRTIALDDSTDCVGGLDLGQNLTGVPVPCSAFGAQDLRVPAGIWLRPGTSTAESVSEIFRP